MGTYFHFADDVQITLTKENLNKLIEQADSDARYRCMQFVKEAMGFSRNKSFDEIAPIVKGWKEAAEKAAEHD